MNQEIAQRIVQNIYGNNAIALGHCNQGIFWIFSNESEELFKVHKVDWNEYITALEEVEK